MIIIRFILFLSYLLYHVQSGNFCFSLCSIRSCWGINQNQCTGCTTGFQGNGSGSCVTATLVPLSTAAKYMTIGTTPDITYDLKSNTTVYNMTLSSTKNPFSASCWNYNYYGDFGNNDKLTISHPGISDPLLYFYKVRIRGGVITIDRWDNSANLSILFTSNASEPEYQISIGNGMDEQQRLCQTSGDNQDYRVFFNEFNWNSTAGFDFQISVKNNTRTNPWGIMYVAVSVKLCHGWCTACFGDVSTTCYACNYNVYLTKLSGTTCALTCLTGYGNDTNTPDTCIKCATNCSSCLDISTNCTVCYGGYYLLPNANGTGCIGTCPSHYYPNNTAPANCVECDANCLNCTNISTKCTSCNAGQYLYNFFCYATCPNQTYANATSMKCFNCNNFCSVCTSNSTNCSVCDLNGTYKAYLLNTTCYANCPDGYFNNDVGGAGPNVCTPCDPSCTRCSINSTFCHSCNISFYYLANTCNSTCPAPDYFADNNTWSCLSCATACVSLNMNVYFSDSLKQQLICDMTFSQGLSWSIADIQAFATITIDDPLLTLANFDITYEVAAPNVMRIRMAPKGFIFIYNATVTFTTRSFNGTYDRAANGYPFSDPIYASTKSISWFLIKAPSLSQTQKSIIDGVSKLSTKILDFTTAPYFQQLKKAGVFALFMGGAQATSTACLVNTIPAQNFYEGVRLWAAFVFFDVPQWQQNSNKTKYMVVPEVNKLVKDSRLLLEDQTSIEFNNQKSQGHQENSKQRLLFDTSTIGWRFQRTGHTSFFIYDAYINIFLIILCWILLIIANFCIKHKIHHKKMVSFFYSFTHKVHQVSIFYISLTTLLEWIYFDAASIQRWVSFGVCLLFNIYFLGYELYIYHDMINYPSAQIGNQKYEYFCLKYGSFLKNIRFLEYDKKQKWNFRHWFRPYNYHILSYYKKFLMMISLPIFYGTVNYQTYVLMGIQLFQILRFITVWPFYSTIRNIIRLVLQFCLFAFFASILIQSYMLKEIMLSDPNTLQAAVDLYYKMGWAGFCMVFIFNIGFILILIYDTVKGCRQSNRQMMDEMRKFYYMQRLKTYQQQNQDIPLSLVNKWVKLGNLNDRKYDELPDISLRIQYFKIMKLNKVYQIDMRIVVELFMNIDFNFNKDNNVTAGKKLNKRIVLDKSLSPTFYYFIEQLYIKYNQLMDLEYMIIKTFIKVIQSDYQPGQKIQLKTSQMDQKIQIQTYAGQKKVFKLDKLLPGFPLPYQDLIKLA